MPDSADRSVLPTPDRTDAGGPSAWVRIDLDEAAQGADVHITLEQRLRAAMARL